MRLIFSWNLITRQKVIRRSAGLILFNVVMFYGSLNALDSATSPQPEIRTLLSILRDFVQKEKALVRAPQHASRFHFQLNEKNEVRLDRPVVLLAHGLLDSPANLINLEGLAAASGAHVMNIRLPGHFEKDFRHLDEVTAQEWIDRMEQAYLWAENLTSKITVGGHSTGGLLAARLAANHPDTIQKLLLFSPAFGISSTVDLTISSFTLLQLSGWIVGPPKRDYRYYSSYAGSELAQLITKLEGQNEFGDTVTALRNTQILWFDSSLDLVIDTKKNQRIFEQIKAVNPAADRHLLGPLLLTIHEHSACLEYLAAHYQTPLIKSFFGTQSDLQ